MDPHEFEDDGSGITCEKCRLPKRHKEMHPDPTVAPTPNPGLASDLDAARAARDAGMGQAVTAPSVAEWRANAQACVRRLARSQQPFTADDVVAAVGLPHQSEANANNALGGLFAGASRAKLIERTGEMVESRRVVGHARRIPVWKGTREDHT